MMPYARDLAPGESGGGLMLVLVPRDCERMQVVYQEQHADGHSGGHLLCGGAAVKRVLLFGGAFVTGAGGGSAGGGRHGGAAGLAAAGKLAGPAPRRGGAHSGARGRGGRKRSRPHACPPAGRPGHDPDLWLSRCNQEKKGKAQSRRNRRLCQEMFVG